MAVGVKTGGRQKGVKNRASIARQTEVEQSGLTPLDYMLEVLRDKTQDLKRRDWAANAAAPYVHPKLANVEIGNKGGEPFKVTLESVDGGVL